MPKLRYVVELDLPAELTVDPSADAEGIRDALWEFFPQVEKTAIRVVPTTTPFPAEMNAITENVMRLLDACDKHTEEARKMTLAEFIEKSPSGCRWCMREEEAGGRANALRRIRALAEGLGTDQAGIDIADRCTAELQESGDEKDETL